MVYQPPSLRLALGLGDQELEQRLRPALDAVDDLAVVAQCLSADQLLQTAQARQVDAVVVAWSLHRLTDTVLEHIERCGLPTVLLVPDPDDSRWARRGGTVLAVTAEPAAVRQALLAARRGEHVLPRPRPSTERVVAKPGDRPEQLPEARIIAVAGGVGSPGRTTVAINLATALGASWPTVLVEADFDAPALAAYLDRDPSRNLCTLAHAVREDRHLWGPALADELQPLSRFSPSAVALCGPPKREMRTGIAPAFIDQLMGELARRYRYVIVDLGAELLGTGASATSHRAALACARQVLLVSGSDLVGLWHTRVALDHLERYLGMEREQVSLVLNRHAARHHHSPAEVEWHLGATVAAVVPFDHSATEQAIAQRRPLVAEPGSRASRALLALAERVHEGRLRLPSAVVGTDGGRENTSGRSRRWWQRAAVVLGGTSADAPRPLVADSTPIRMTASRARRGQVPW